MTVRALANEPRFEFHHVRGYAMRMDFVRKVFEQMIEPLYGSQERNWEEIVKGEDRKCRLLYSGTKPVGLVVYKTELTKRDDALEIKVLRPIDANDRQVANKLLERVMEVAKELQAKSIHIWVTEKDKTILDFFNDQEFTTIDRGSGQERLLCKQLEKPSRKRAAEEPAVSDRGKRQEVARPVQIPPPFSSVAKPEVKTHGVPIKREYLSWISGGYKTVEGRIPIGHFSRVNEGDNFNFFSGSQSVKCRIIGVKRYSTFREMLESEGFKNCIPYARSLEEAVAIYENIPGYREKAQQFGVVAYRLQKMSS